MTPVDIRIQFWRSEAFYCYEDSALAIEAQLCGCPPSSCQTRCSQGRRSPASNSGGTDPCIMGEADGLERARRTVGRIKPIIRGHMELVPARIAELGRKWKSLAAQEHYRGTIDYPFEPRFVVVPKPGRDADAGCGLPHPWSLWITKPCARSGTKRTVLASLTGRWLC